MKAKEYFDKFGPDIWDEWKSDNPDCGSHITVTFYKDMYNEMVETIKTRRVQSDKALFSLIEEFNQKWNAVVNMFEKKYGESPLKRNGFISASHKHLGILSKWNSEENVK